MMARRYGIGRRIRRVFDANRNLKKKLCHALNFSTMTGSGLVFRDVAATPQSTTRVKLLKSNRPCICTCPLNNTKRKNTERKLK